jgi:hypothetical protein
VTDQIPNADYVRIEIHVDGQMQVFEFLPDQGQKIKAVLGFEIPSDGALRSAEAARGPVPRSHLSLDVTGPTVVHTMGVAERDYLPYGRPSR